MDVRTQFSPFDMWLECARAVCLLLFGCFFFCGGGGALRNRSSAAQMDANERQRPRSPHTIGCGGVRGGRNLEHEVRRWVLVIDISKTNNKNKHMRPLALIKATLLRGEHERKRTQKRHAHMVTEHTSHTKPKIYRKLTNLPCFEFGNYEYACPFSPRIHYRLIVAASPIYNTDLIGGSASFFQFYSFLHR